MKTVIKRLRQIKVFKQRLQSVPLSTIRILSSGKRNSRNTINNVKCTKDTWLRLKKSTVSRKTLILKQRMLGSAKKARKLEVMPKVLTTSPLSLTKC